MVTLSRSLVVAKPEYAQHAGHSAAASHRGRLPSLTELGCGLFRRWQSGQHSQLLHVLKVAQLRSQDPKQCVLAQVPARRSHHCVRALPHTKLGCGIGIRGAASTCWLALRAGFEARGSLMLSVIRLARRQAFLYAYQRQNA